MRREIVVLLAVLAVAAVVAGALFRPSPSDRLSEADLRRISLEGVRLGETYEEAARWGRLERRVENRRSIWRVDGYGPFRTFTLLSQPGERDLWLTAVLLGGQPQVEGRPVFDGPPTEARLHERLGEPTRTKPVGGAELWFYPVDLVRPVADGDRLFEVGVLCVRVEKGRAAGFSLELPWND